MPLRYSAHTLDSTASPKYLPSEPPEAPTCGCAGGVQCSGPLGVLELCAVVHAVSLALPLGAPGSVVGLAVYDSRLGSSGSSVRVRNSIHISVRTMLEMLPSQSRFVFRARGHGA